jgi:hypothetical protein
MMGRAITDVVIAVDGDAGTTRKIGRFLSFRDGSAGFLLPYNPYKTGRLCILRVPLSFRDFGTGPLQVERDIETTEPVKFSVHMTGLVQFSLTGGSIPSGGRLAPKGIGIYSHRLLDPPETGPTFGATIFDLKAHAPLEGMGVATCD